MEERAYLGCFRGRGPSRQQAAAGTEAESLSHLHCETSLGPVNVLCGYSFCGFMCITAVSCPEDSISHHSSPVTVLIPLALASVFSEPDGGSRV